MTFFIVNNDKFQIPLSFGYDFFISGNKKYNGIGVILAYNHLFKKTFILLEVLVLDIALFSPIKESSVMNSNKHLLEQQKAVKECIKTRLHK
jgi:hypothetical protein